MVHTLKLSQTEIFHSTVITTYSFLTTNIAFSAYQINSIWKSWDKLSKGFWWQSWNNSLNVCFDNTSGTASLTRIVRSFYLSTNKESHKSDSFYHWSNFEAFVEMYLSTDLLYALWKTFRTTRNQWYIESISTN